MGPPQAAPGHPASTQQSAALFGGSTAFGGFGGAPIGGAPINDPWRSSSADSSGSNNNNHNASSGGGAEHKKKQAPFGGFGGFGGFGSYDGEANQ